MIGDVPAQMARRVREQAVRSYLARYEPRRAIKLVGGPGGGRGDGAVEAWPL